ncbi:MAG: hypothetical protein KKA67_11465 [Spirochaetes bacterium]|nr:hypothetical protein [Spirochaetota bacterium]MBU1082314.1 hypothetical protein [Spirochaetota bacterium]
MTATGARALLAGERYFGMGTLDEGSGALRVEAYAEDPGGVVYSLADEEISTVSLRAIAEGSGAILGPRTFRGPRSVLGLRAIVAFDPALGPFRFGLHNYDPFRSLSASLGRAEGGTASLALALWAAMEGDLFRFAYDGDFTTALETARGSGEWGRFAELNDLYRAMIRAVAPFGTVPPSWSAWLRDDPGSRGAGSTGSSLGRKIDKALGKAVTRPSSAVCSALLRARGGSGLFELPRH